MSIALVHRAPRGVSFWRYSTWQHCTCFCQSYYMPPPHAGPVALSFHQTLSTTALGTIQCCAPPPHQHALSGRMATSRCQQQLALRPQQSCFVQRVWRLWTAGAPRCRSSCMCERPRNPQILVKIRLEQLALACRPAAAGVDGVPSCCAGSARGRRDHARRPEARVRPGATRRRAACRRHGLADPTGAWRESAAECRARGALVIASPVTVMRVDTAVAVLQCGMLHLSLQACRASTP